MRRRYLLAGGGALALGGAGALYGGRQGMGSMADYDASVAATRAALAQQPEMRDLIGFATLAPNGHNTQPWRFRIGAGRIDILPDVSRRTPVVDPDDHHLFVALGCAAENLALAAAARGIPGDPSFDPAEGGAVLFAASRGPRAGSTLFDAIPRGQSTRAEFDGNPVSAADLRTLKQAAEIPGVETVLLTSRPEIGRVRNLVVAGNSAQMADPAFMRELESWLRFSPRQAMQTGDGLLTAASGSPVLPAWLGPRILGWVLNAAAENDKYARQPRSSPGIAVFVSERPTPTIESVRDGRASVSRCRRRRWASSTPSSTSPSRSRACGRSWQAWSARLGAAPISSCASATARRCRSRPAGRCRPSWLEAHPSAGRE